MLGKEQVRRSYDFEYDFDENTLFGHHFTLSLRGRMDVVDRHAFLRQGLLDETQRRHAVHKVNLEALYAVVHENNFFFVYDVSADGAVRIGCYQWRDGAAHYDPNREKLLSAVQKMSELVWPEASYGVRVKLQSIVPFWNSKQLERNKAMWPPKAMEKIMTSEPYRLDLERNVVAILSGMEKERERYARQSWSDSGIAIEARALPGGVALKWHVNVGWRPRTAWRLHGFRTTESFKEFSAGVQILDTAAASGDMLDTVAEGETYFYTLFIPFTIRPGVFGGVATSGQQGPVRFTINVPRRPAESPPPRKSSQEVYREKARAAIIGAMDTRDATRAILAAYRDISDEIDNDRDIPKDHRRAAKDAVAFQLMEQAQDQLGIKLDLQ